LKLFELKYWNGTVLNVSHGTIPVYKEFMHALMQRPVRCALMCRKLAQKDPGTSICTYSVTAPEQTTKAALRIADDCAETIRHV
jgi:hypothetical protein